MDQDTETIEDVIEDDDLEEVEDVPRSGRRQLTHLERLRQEC